MSQINLPLQMPTAPAGFCQTLGPDWVNQLLALVAQGVAILQAPGTGYLIINQEGTPDPTQRTGYLWRKPSMGSLLFQYIGGFWVCPHLEAPAGNSRRLYEGDEASLATYDGGSVGAIGDNSGPMWAIDHNYDGRSPMGPGAIPTSNPSKTLALSEAFGEGAHSLTADENGQHSHTPPTSNDTFATLKDGTGAAMDNTALRTVSDSAEATNGWLGSHPTGTSGTGAAHNTVHPVRGCYVIVRTARKNYVAA